MGSAVKALKRTFLKLVAIVAVVYLCAVGLAALAPGVFASIAGVSAAGGALSAAYTVVSSVMLSTSMLVTFGITAYLSYSGDKEAAEARQQLEKEVANAEANAKEHFLDMEEDRYQDYDGPAIGITWPREVEEGFEAIGKDGVHVDDPTIASSTKVLLALTLLGGYLWVA